MTNFMAGDLYVRIDSGDPLVCRILTRLSENTLDKAPVCAGLV